MKNMTTPLSTNVSAPLGLTNGGMGSTRMNSKSILGLGATALIISKKKNLRYHKTGKSS